MKNLPAQILESSAQDEVIAISELKNNLKISHLGGLLFFCSSSYQLQKLAMAINDAFDCPVIGCTTSGEIGKKYRSGSIVALALSTSHFALHSVLLTNIKDFDQENATQSVKEMEHDLVFSSYYSNDKMFGFLLSDGLAMQEEKIISTVYQALGGMDVFGGSAGDDLKFKQTCVFFEGQFYSNAAITSVIEVTADIDLFSLQHFAPSGKELITTDVDYKNRLVYEINGEPAAIAYAKINDLNVNDLSNKDFAMYPLMLSLNDEWYIRSIANVNADKSLSFYCAIDSGLPLTIGSGICMVENLENQVAKIAAEFKEIYFTLGCDCIFRQLEIAEKKQFTEIESLLSQLNFIGFSTYGEQLNGVHINQTLVAIVVGEKYEQ